MNGIATPAELAALTASLDDYCARNGVADPRDREDVASLLIKLHGRGITDRVELDKLLKEQNRVNLPG